MTLAVLDPAAGTLSIAQIGLSRLYIFRRGSCLLPLHDHSVPTQVGLAHGFSSSHYADALVHRAAVTRLLGIAQGVQVDLTVVPMAAADVVILCSSAVWNHDSGDHVSPNQQVDGDVIQLDDGLHGRRAAVP